MRRFLSIAALLLQYVPQAFNSATPAGSWSFVQGTSIQLAFSGGNCVLTEGGSGFPAPSTSGDLIVTGVLDVSGNGETLTVSNGLSGTTNPAFVGNSSSSPTFSSWTFNGWSTVLSASGADTITFTTNSGGVTLCQAMEFRWSAGGLSGTPLDQAGVIQQVSTTPSVTTSGNLTANGELVIGAFVNSSGGGCYTGAGSGFTLGSGADAGFMEYKILASGTGSGATQTATANTISSSCDATANAVATFKHP
jgi:hypothetical protein